MNKSHVAAAVVIAVAAFVAWRFWRNTANNGDAVAPMTPGMSNSPVIEPSGQWDTPYYLRSNYPAERGDDSALPIIATPFATDDPSTPYTAPSDMMPRL